MFNFQFSKLLKVLFVLALLLFCALLGWAVVLFVLGMNIQWWVKAMILICLAATGIIVYLLWKLWLKRKEMKFVDGIIGTEMPGNVSAIDEASRELRRRFKEAISTLKKSHLRGRGNPLYVLPWYLMIGKSGSGKSTAIKSARLPSPFGDINRISGIEGTRNCDWWFFDDSVVIDIAGRYSVHRNEDLDRNEWLAFLKHLVKYRKKEPINGIIVTVEADQLLENDPEKIEEEGRIIRKRVDEVIHVMGAKFPIFLMVTKCDLIFGMNRFCQLLSEETLNQAMGMINHDSETDISTLVDKTVDTLVDKLKDIRLILSNKDEVRDRHYVDPEVLVFPEELSRLRKGLQLFCQGAFKDNPFQELPLIRGIYLCSGQQSGRPVPSRASAASKLNSQELPDTGHGFFLHDFFSRILPADRSLYAPTRRAMEWQRLTSNLWLTGFVTVVLLFCILLTHSWNENKTAINTVSPEFREAILFKNDPVIDIATMVEFGHQIKKIEEINRNWKTPRMGLNASIRLESDLKKRYCQRFYEHFDADINNRIEGKIVESGWTKDNYEPAVRYIPFLARRINLLKARFIGADADILLSRPDPDYALMMFGGAREKPADDVLGHYKSAYIDYLVWQKEVEPLNRSLAGMQRLLSNYFSESEGDMRWLVTWADLHLQDRAITMNTFWHGNRSDAEMVSISPAFTREGQKLIGHFVTRELESAVDKYLAIARPKEEFADWYQEAFYDAWMLFCEEFDKGADLFETNGDWEDSLELLTSDISPYQKLFDTLEDELFSVKDQEHWPSLELKAKYVDKYGSWLSQVRNFGIIRHAAVTGDLADKPGAGRIGNKIRNKVGGKTAFAARVALGTIEESRLGKAKDAYRQYQDALAGFAGITDDVKFAYQIARKGFADDSADPESPLHAANKAISGLKISLAREGRGPRAEGEDPLRKLLDGPVDHLWKYSVARAGCHLQDLWDQEVVVKAQTVRDSRQAATMLFGDQGLAQKFIYKYASPFVRQSSSRGYYAIKHQNASIPFYGSFFKFLQKGRQWWAVSGGSVKPGYNVTVLAYPTDVNAEARIKPYMTRLIFETPDGPALLENKQYPVEKRFVWMPAYDGEVTLEIAFENVTLKKHYTGYCAFGQFLKDFAGGSKVFGIEEFPEHLTELARVGVEKIEVSYQMSESQVKPIVRLLNATPGRPPGKIISCDNR